MATFSIGSVGDLNDLQKIKNYLYRLDKQLKYTFSNLDPDENFSERAKLIYATKNDIQAAIEVSLNSISASYVTADTLSEINLSIDGIKQRYVTRDGVAAAINLNEQGVQIEGSKINLKGTVTANNNFKILDDGSMEAVNAKFSGIIKSSEIKIGGPDSSPKFHVTTGGAVTASDITVTGGEIKLGNTPANPYFHVDSDGNLSIGAGSNPPFRVTYAGAVTATKLSIAGGDSSIWLGGTASDPAFSVDKYGAVKATNLKLTGGEINLGLISGSNPADYNFKVSSAGAVTIKSGSINLGLVSGSNPETYRFSVTNAGAVTASNLKLTGGSINLANKFKVDTNGNVWAGGVDNNAPFRVSSSGSVSITGSMTTKGTGTNAPFMTLSDGIISGGKGSTQHGGIIFKDGITKRDPSTGTSSTITAMTLQSPGTVLCGGVFTSLSDNPGQSDPVYQGISRADSQHVITGTDSGSALLDVCYGLDGGFDQQEGWVSYYPLQLQFINGLLVSCALQNEVTIQLW